MKRKPILSRKPVGNFSLKKVRFRTCEMCYANGLCNKYIPEQLEVISICQKDVNFDDLEKIIWGVKDNNKIVKLITDREVPDNIIHAMSFDGKNVLQCNCFVLSNNNKWVCSLANKAQICGLSVVVFVFPIIPDIVKPSHVVLILDMLKSLRNVRVMLGFAISTDEPVICENSVNVNGDAVYLHNITINNKFWECAENYKNEFVSIIHKFSEPRDLKVCSCSRLNCL